MDETQRKRRGHAFLPPKAVLSKLPNLYGTEGAPFEHKTIWAHYFGGPFDWYIAELDPETNEAFGYTRRSDYPDGAEWGYISLTELEGLTGRIQLGDYSFTKAAVERDVHWKPREFGELDL